jgi:hypothetical protein
MPLVAMAAESKELVLAEFPGKPDLPSVQQRGSRLTIELCYDTCNAYSAGQPRSDREVWDAVFLNEYYFNPDVLAESFRAKNNGHAATVLSAYAGHCPSTAKEEARARCISNYLAKRNGVTYSFVRYDEGYRCAVSGAFGEPGKVGSKSKCTKAPHAP